MLPIWLGASEIAVLEEAISDYNKYTCLQWKERTDETSYVDINRDNTNGCWSWVGMLSDNSQPQTLHLGTNCLNVSLSPMHPCTSLFKEICDI